LKLALNVAGENNEEDPDAKLKESLKGRKILCRICKGDHFTTKCPYKDTLQPMDEIAATPGAAKPASPAEPNTTGKYIPAHRRANPTATATDSPRDRRDDSITLRVTNISEDARESDIHALFRKFGQLTRVFVAKDHDTGLCKGYAFVSFDRRDDAQKALEHLNGFGYDNLILRVEWAK
jgi:translation initiation factor 3 subunit G